MTQNAAEGGMQWVQGDRKLCFRHSKETLFPSVQSPGGAPKKDFMNFLFAAVQEQLTLNLLLKYNFALLGNNKHTKSAKGAKNGIYLEREN